MIYLRLYFLANKITDLKPYLDIKPGAGTALNNNKLWIIEFEHSPSDLIHAATSYSWPLHAAISDRGVPRIVISHFLADSLSFPEMRDYQFNFILLITRWIVHCGQPHYLLCDPQFIHIHCEEGSERVRATSDQQERTIESERLKESFSKPFAPVDSWLRTSQCYQLNWYGQTCGWIIRLPLNPKQQLLHMVSLMCCVCGTGLSSVCTGQVNSA